MSDFNYGHPRKNFLFLFLDSVEKYHASGVGIDIAVKGSCAFYKTYPGREKMNVSKFRIQSYRSLTQLVSHSVSELLTE